MNFPNLLTLWRFVIVQCGTETYLSGQNHIRQSGAVLHISKTVKTVALSQNLLKM